MKLPVTITGYVQTGKHIGRRFDVPTANITPREDVSDLARGVYYSRISFDGSEHPSITNLGVRPTVSNDGKVNAETYIYDISADIYGKYVSVCLLEFHRPEQKFASTDELFDVIRADFRSGMLYHDRTQRQP